jgi:hypothetical protein
MGLTFSYLVIFWRDNHSQSYSNGEERQLLFNINSSTPEITSRPINEAAV